MNNELERLEAALVQLYAPDENSHTCTETINTPQATLQPFHIQALSRCNK